MLATSEPPESRRFVDGSVDSEIAFMKGLSAAERALDLEPQAGSAAGVHVAGPLIHAH